MEDRMSGDVSSQAVGSKGLEKAGENARRHVVDFTQGGEPCGLGPGPHDFHRRCEVAGYYGVGNPAECSLRKLQHLAQRLRN